MQSEGVALMYSATIEATDVEISSCQREASVIGNDGIGRGVDPIHQVVLGRLREVGIEVHINRAAPNLKRRVAMWSEGSAEHDEKCTDGTDNHGRTHLNTLRSSMSPAKRGYQTFCEIIVE